MDSMSTGGAEASVPAQPSEPVAQMTIPVPVVAPFGSLIDKPEYVQEVWDAFVKPDQDAGVPQSAEMHLLMAILRAVHKGLSDSAANGTYRAFVEACPGTVGVKPSWMSRDQYDADGGPCKCVLPPGHLPPCACEHTTANAPRGES
jgi:hypothetical protein